MRNVAIGLDFGTESARAEAVDVASGEVLALAVCPYADGVIDHRLPGEGPGLPPEWALQNPVDWLSAMEVVTCRVIAEGNIGTEEVKGIGIDFTSCTILPTLSDGTPLSTVDGLHTQPHAWPKLWKHHAAQPQADRVNALAAARNEVWLARYGGRISSEWLVPKALQMLEEAPELYAKSAYLVEGADWIVWQLTRKLVRSACSAGYKAMWHKKDGFPSGSFLAALHAGLADLYSNKLAGPVVAPGTLVGTLSETWSERLGLAAETAVAAPMIDAHAAVLGGGVIGPETLFMIMGTSTCHLLIADREVPVEGISGVVEDGIYPDLFGYEAGQAGVGDIFAWFVDNSVPAAYTEEASKRGLTAHAVLSEKAGLLRPGQSGLLALDWWNGCRTPLVDADLSGAILGYSLQTSPEAVYRTLIEATAFGTRLILQAFSNAGLPVSYLRVSGGLTKNDVLLGIYADVVGLPIEVAAAEQASALGAAILGAVASGAYMTVAAGVGGMVPRPVLTVLPRQEHLGLYDSLYSEYLRLVDVFGRDTRSTLKRLRALRHAV